MLCKITINLSGKKSKETYTILTLKQLKSSGRLSFMTFHCLHLISHAAY